MWTQSVDGTRFNVWRYQISTRTPTLVPNPTDKVHSAAAVNPSGTVYFEQSGSACGSGVTIEQYPVGGPVTADGTLPAGIDLFHPFALRAQPVRRPPVRAPALQRAARPTSTGRRSPSQLARGHAPPR